MPPFEANQPRHVHARTVHVSQVVPDLAHVEFRLTRACARHHRALRRAPRRAPFQSQNRGAAGLGLEPRLADPELGAGPAWAWPGTAPLNWRKRFYGAQRHPAAAQLHPGSAQLHPGMRAHSPSSPLAHRVSRRSIAAAAIRRRRPTLTLGTCPERTISRMVRSPMPRRAAACLTSSA
jgi:hypothetical protein